MPRGKAQLSEAAADSKGSGHSSMRRLSSFASLQQLLPFSRSRRTTATTDDSLTSDTSSIPSSSALPSPCDAKSQPRVLQETSHNIRPAPRHAYGGFLRKSNYVSIPDEHTGGLPRSKTLSNLPLAVKSRKQQQRTPSDTVIEEPSLYPNTTRLPTPTGSTRRYLPLGTVNHIRSGIRSKLPRSDTEPLLVGKDKHKIDLGQPRPSKENVPVDIFKQSLASTVESDLFRSSFMTDDSTASTPTKSREQPGTLPRHPSFSGAVPKSSPVLKSKPAPRLQLGSTVKPQGQIPLAQRWNSQPNLFQNHIGSSIGKGKAPARRGPTPPPSSIPFFAEQITSSLLYQSHRRNPLGRLDESVVVESEQPQHSTSPVVKVKREVLEAQPAAYWAGRLSTLLDRAKDQEAIKFFTELGDDLFFRHDSDRVYEKSMQTSRIREAFEGMYAVCATPEARESFVAFQMQYAAMNNDPELAKPVGRSTPMVLKTRAGEVSKISSDGSSPSSSSRKSSFMNKLLGRGKRSSLAS